MEAKLLLAACILGLALGMTEGIVIRQMSGHGACGVKSAHLNHDVEPKRYHVSLRLTDLKAPDFDGQVEIEVKVNGHKKDEDDNLHANQIFLHADESIEIEDAWYKKTSQAGSLLHLRGTRVEVVGVCLNTDYQVLVVTLAEDLRPGSKGKLHLRYKAKYGKTGLKRGSFAWNNERFLQITFAGHNFARRVFPSFDEPTFRARFALEIACSKLLKPMSNEVSDVDNDRETEDGLKVNKFAPTAKIETKDLALSIVHSN